MAENETKDVFVRVKDGAGNEFLCPLEALRSTGEASEEELSNCVDDATVGRYASNIKVEDKG